MTEKKKEPILPDIVLLGLILVSFFPPIVFPITYPPISENMHINKIKNTKRTPSSYSKTVTTKNKKKIYKKDIDLNGIHFFFQFLLEVFFLIIDIK